MCYQISWVLSPVTYKMFPLEVCKLKLLQSSRRSSSGGNGAEETWPERPVWWWCKKWIKPEQGTERQERTKQRRRSEVRWQHEKLKARCWRAVDSRGREGRGREKRNVNNPWVYEKWQEPDSCAPAAAESQKLNYCWYKLFRTNNYEWINNKIQISKQHASHHHVDSLMTFKCPLPWAFKQLTHKMEKHDSSFLVTLSTPAREVKGLPCPSK